MLAHQFREFDDRGVRTNPFNALVHRFFDFHGRSPLLEDAAPHSGVNVGTYRILPTINGKDDWTEVQSFASLENRSSNFWLARPIHGDQADEEMRPIASCSCSTPFFDA